MSFLSGLVTRTKKCSWEHFSPFDRDEIQVTLPKWCQKVELDTSEVEVP